MRSPKVHEFPQRNLNSETAARRVAQSTTQILFNSFKSTRKHNLDWLSAHRQRYSMWLHCSALKDVGRLPSHPEYQRHFRALKHVGPLPAAGSTKGTLGLGRQRSIASGRGTRAPARRGGAEPQRKIKQKECSLERPSWFRRESEMVPRKTKLQTENKNKWTFQMDDTENNGTQ